jgi:hypothetical protein
MSQQLFDLTASLRQPEYTGENRCTPCTIVNVLIAVGLSGAVGVVFPFAGVAVFLVSLASIYFRGYLVPGTPMLTKRYFPDRVLRWFDKEPEPGAGGFTPAASTDSTDAATADASTASGSADESASVTDDTAADDADAAASPEQEAAEAAVDPERLLFDLNAVEPCEDVDDLCLTDEFAAAWTEAVRERRTDPFDPEKLARLFRVDDADRVTVTEHGKGHTIRVTDVGQQQWISRGAVVADLAADAVLSERHDRWDAVETAQRLSILTALRSFAPTCPLCEGLVELGDETVESCCRSYEVVVAACTDCEERLFEINAQQL